MNDLFLLIIEIIGTMAFAISGIRLAAAKSFDWFGAYSAGLVTAIGGGTMRDVLLNTTPFWMNSGWYLAVTGLSLAIVIVFKKYLVKLNQTFLLFDTIGLALFVVIGIQKTLLFGFPMWTAIFMGTMTGALGGVLRDIFINMEPQIFREEVYATACIAGGVVYWLVLLVDGSDVVAQISCAATVIVLRYLSVRYGWSIPHMHDYVEQENNKKTNG